MSEPKRQPASLARDPVIEVYKPGVDMTLVRENLKLTPSERLAKMIEFAEAMDEIRGVASGGRRQR